MFNELQSQSHPATQVQPTLDSTPQGKSTKSKGSKNSLPLIIALAILAILGIGTSIFAFIQNSAKDSEISDLKAQLNNDGDHSDAGTEPAISSQGVFLLADALERYPYYLAAKSDDPDGLNGWASNEDSFYLLNMNKLGTNDALQPFNLTEILHPIIDNTIASSLPESSTNALGNVTTRSQCNSFDIFYTDPRNDSSQRPLFLPGPNEYNPETDIPVNANYFCHTNDYDVVYLSTTYIININDKKVNTYSTTSDFSNQN